MTRWLRNSGMPGDAIERWRVGFMARGALRGAIGWYRGLPILEPHRVREPCTVPTSFVWSSGDFALSRTGAELTAQWVAAPYRFVMLESASHWLMDQHPDTLAAQVVAGPPD